METFTDRLYYQNSYSYAVSTSYIKRIDTSTQPLDAYSTYGAEITSSKAIRFLERQFNTKGASIFIIKVVRNPKGKHTLLYHSNLRRMIYLNTMFIGNTDTEKDMLCKTLQKAKRMLGDELRIEVDVYITAGGETIKL